MIEGCFVCVVVVVVVGGWGVGRREGEKQTDRDRHASHSQLVSMLFLPDLIILSASQPPVMLHGPITNQGTTLNTQLCDNDHYIIKLWNHIKQPTYVTGPSHQPGHDVKHTVL